MSSLQNKTVFITGASRGIGKAIGVRLAKEGAKIIIGAKSTTKHPFLPGTIYSAAEEMKEAGAADVLPLKLDVRNEEEIHSVVTEAAEKMGGIDMLINNAGAIFLAPVEDTPAKRFDLMMQVNVRASFLMAQACLPYLRKSDNPHIVNFSPPLDLDPKWFKDHVAYTISKYGMSMCVLGMAEAYREEKISVNALWPKTVIATAALKMLGDKVNPKNCRNEEIMADAIHALFSSDEFITGQFLLDEDLLKSRGQTEFSQYAIEKDQPLLPDLFIKAS